jgi:hypothetical protein
VCRSQRSERPLEPFPGANCQGEGDGIQRVAVRQGETLSDFETQNITSFVARQLVISGGLVAVVEVLEEDLRVSGVHECQEQSQVRQQ